MAKSIAAKLKTWEASHRFAKIAPRKARLMIDVIRGLSCSEALEQLRFSTRRSTKMVHDVLRSAMASADEAEADMRKLHIADARVDGGPYHRRWRPKDRGRAHPILKRTSHILITVVEKR